MVDGNIITEAGPVSTGTDPVTITPSIPAIEATPVTITPESPKIEIAPVVDEVAKTPEPVKAETPKIETVLGSDPKAEVKPEIKPEGEVKPEAEKVESSQSEEPAPLPTYESFVLPEGVSLDNQRLGEFTKELAEFETSPKTHEEFQKFGQKLVDKHVAEVQNTVQRLTEHYQQAWEKQTNDWKDAFIADPKIGGNRQETTVKSALEFIRTHGGTAEQQNEFRNLMQTTGIGNHPAVIRLLANAMNANREGQPIPASKPVPKVTSKIQRRYGDT